MIKALILYYLSIKPTHGYEIQKFIQLNHMDSWTQIRSGSIYYALSKLEKKGSIQLFREDSIGAKTRKVYKITERGEEELQNCLEKELNREIYNIGSDKFIIYPILNGIKKEAIIENVKKHIKALEAKKKDIIKWKNIKVNNQALKIESISFEMMLSSLDYQIKWHKALLEEIDACISISNQMSDFIRHVDFTSLEHSEDAMKKARQDDINKIKNEILANPETAEEKLDQLIKILKK